jgi:hypothetical protein
VYGWIIGSILKTIFGGLLIYQHISDVIARLTRWTCGMLEKGMDLTWTHPSLFFTLYKLARHNGPQNNSIAFFDTWHKIERKN